MVQLNFIFLSFVVFVDLSVVTRAWLLECYNRQKRVPIKDYLVGDSIAPIDDIDDDDEIVSSQAINEGIENNINENFGNLKLIAASVVIT